MSGPRRGSAVPRRSGVAVARSRLRGHSGVTRPEIATCGLLVGAVGWCVSTGQQLGLRVNLAATDAVGDLLKEVRGNDFGCYGS